MGQVNESAETYDVESYDISTGWRAFQAVALISAVSWLLSYILFVQPFAWVGPLFANGVVPKWGNVIFDISPLLSVVIILMAVAPRTLAFMDDDDWLGIIARSLLAFYAAAWMINVLIATPMVGMLFEQPLAASKMVPVFGGVFFHVVIQHWFQAVAGFVFAVASDPFEVLTEAPTPSGVQCAVVDCT